MVNSEKQRVQLQRDAQKKAAHARYDLRLGTHGQVDLFNLLFAQGIVHIRKPLGPEETQLSGFISRVNGLTVVVTNSSKSLGHEHFAAAHELYHFLFDLPQMKQQNWQHVSHAERFFLQNEEMEYLADQFAVHFLMPEEAVLDHFARYVDLESHKVAPEHALMLQQLFRVSYDAMVLRLLECELIDKKRYEYLTEFGGNKAWLERTARQEGLPVDLHHAARVYEIPQRYVHMIRANYEAGLISYRKLESILSLIGKTPQVFGYLPPKEITQGGEGVPDEYLALVDDLLHDETRDNT